MVKGFFTRKQIWRRIVKESPKPCAELDEYFDELANEFDIKSRTQSAPELHVPSAPSGIAASKKTRSVDSGLSASKHGIKVPKSVNFSNTDSVVLVPTRQEYFDHKLDRVLWWKSDDYTKFKQSAVLEVSAIINIYRVDAKTALQKLAIGDLDERHSDLGEEKNEKPDVGISLHDDSNYTTKNRSNVQSLFSVTEYFTKLNALSGHTGATSDSSFQLKDSSQCNSAVIHPLACLAH
jgi:hypothetical protein